MMIGFTGNNNRMDTYGYDAAGNLLNDGNHSYSYDGFSQLTNVDAGTTAYYYSGVLQRGEVFAGGHHLATYWNSTTFFDHADWLGTERARTPYPGGAPCETITSLPFGDNQTTAGSCTDASPKHFTGKEHDFESGLDDFDARYYSSSLGRFVIPDWAEKPTAVPYAAFGDPQTLSLYVYVRNNPVGNLDADGHWCVFGLGTTCVKPPPTPPTPDPAGVRNQYAPPSASSPSRPHPTDHSDIDNKINNQITSVILNAFTFGAFASASEGGGAGGDEASSEDAGAEGAVAEVAGAEAAATDEAGAAEVTAANGTKVTGFTTHGVDRAVGEGAPGAPGVRAGTRPEAILDALKSPKSVQTGVDSQGRPFQIFTGQNARVIVNPESGKIVSVNPTSAAGAH